MKTEDKQRTGEGSGGIFSDMRRSWDQIGVKCCNQIGKSVTAVLMRSSTEELAMILWELRVVMFEST